MQGKFERPTFSPWSLHKSSESGTSLVLPRLDFMRGYRVADHNVIVKTKELLERGGLEEIGRGEDMVAFSRPDLGFVIKFPYDDATQQPARFPYRVSFGYSLAKEYLGFLFTPSIDIYGIFTDGNSKEYGIIAILQQKVKTLKDVFKALSSQGLFDEIARIKHEFIELNQKMWERGIFDCDSNWEENYGLLPEGMLVLIDVGRLSDDPKEFPMFEGIPRIRQYEKGLRDNFTDENFRRFFGIKPHAKTPSPSPRLKSLQLY